jgi:hypothetical protein
MKKEALPYIILFLFSITLIAYGFSKIYMPKPEQFDMCITKYQITNTGVLVLEGEESVYVIRNFTGEVPFGCVTIKNNKIRRTE